MFPLPTKDLACGTFSFTLFRLISLCTGLWTLYTLAIVARRSRGHLSLTSLLCVSLDDGEGRGRIRLVPVSASMCRMHRSLLSCKRALFRTEGCGFCFLIRWFCSPIGHQRERIEGVGNNSPRFRSAGRRLATLRTSGIALLSLTKRWGGGCSGFMLPLLRTHGCN